MVYDDRGRLLFSKNRGNGREDGLIGFSGTAVSMRYSSIIYTYDEDGMTIYSKAA